MNIATYQTTPEKHGEETFFFTDCGHNMYSIRDSMAYHGCLCPSWLNYEAEHAGINVSRVLQEALMNVLNVKRNI